MVVQTEGKSHQPPPSRRELRTLARQNRALALSIEQQHLKSIAAESAVSALQDAFVDRTAYLPSNFGFDVRTVYGINTYSSVSDRDQGANRPFIEDNVDAGYARGLARWVTGSSGPGVGCSENLKNYVIGTGFKISAAARKRVEAPAGLVDDIQRFLDDTLKANSWQCDGDREFYWRGERDGEVFLALYYRADGRTDFRFIEPEQIIEPAGRPWEDAYLADRFGLKIDYATSWKFGIHTYEHDTNHVLGYCVQWGPGEPVDYLPATQVIHWKCNVDRNIKRGLSSFYPVWKWLTKQDDLMSRTADGATRLAAIAYIRQYATATKQQVQTMADGQADHKRTRRTVNGTEELYRRNGSGSEIVDIPKGQEYVDGPHGAERGNAFLAVIQGLLRQVGIRFCMPEYMVSGDASNGNYSSSIEAGGPFNNFCKARQGMLVTPLEKILWLCLEHAFRRGRFRSPSYDGLTWEQLRASIDITLVPPDVAPNKGQEETDRRSKLHERGVLSTETWQEQEGLDPDKERIRGATGQSTEAPAGLEQVTMLLEKAKNGTIPAGSLKPLIQLAAPQLTPAQIDAVVAPLSELAAAPLQGPAAQGYTGIKRSQWIRIERAVKDVAAGLKAGTTTPPMAQAFLVQYGLTPQQAEAIIADAQDGSIDELQLMESVRTDLWLDRVWEGYP
jgi:hypothetical protein